MSITIEVDEGLLAATMRSQGCDSAREAVERVLQMALRDSQPAIAVLSTLSSEHALESHNDGPGSSLVALLDEIESTITSTVDVQDVLDAIDRGRAERFVF